MYKIFSTPLENHEIETPGVFAQTAQILSKKASPTNYYTQIPESEVETLLKETFQIEVGNIPEAFEIWKQGKIQIFWEIFTRNLEGPQISEIIEEFNLWAAYHQFFKDKKIQPECSLDLFPAFPDGHLKNGLRAILRGNNTTCYQACKQALCNKWMQNLLRRAYIREVASKQNLKEQEKAQKDVFLPIKEQMETHFETSENPLYKSEAVKLLLLTEISWEYLKENAS
jgi:hypothetical protein